MFNIGRVHVFCVEMVYLVLKEGIFHSKVSYIDWDIQSNLVSTYMCTLKWAPNLYFISEISNFYQ